MIYNVEYSSSETRKYYRFCKDFRQAFIHIISLAVYSTNPIIPNKFNCTCTLNGDVIFSEDNVEDFMDKIKLNTDYLQAVIVDEDLKVNMANEYNIFKRQINSQIYKMYKQIKKGFDLFKTILEKKGVSTEKDNLIRAIRIADHFLKIPNIKITSKTLKPFNNLFDIEYKSSEIQEYNHFCKNIRQAIIEIASLVAYSMKSVKHDCFTCECTLDGDVIFSEDDVEDFMDDICQYANLVRHILSDENLKAQMIINYKKSKDDLNVQLFKMFEPTELAFDFLSNFLKMEEIQINKEILVKIVKFADDNYKFQRSNTSEKIVSNV